MEELKKKKEKVFWGDLEPGDTIIFEPFEDNMTRWWFIVGVVPFDDRNQIVSEDHPESSYPYDTVTIYYVDFCMENRYTNKKLSRASGIQADKKVVANYENPGVDYLKRRYVV